MAYVLRVSDATFVRDGETLVGPFSLTLQAGEFANLELPDALAARIAARICAAIVKPTSGTVYVGDYQTRLQPPQAKRMVGFVDAVGFRGSEHAFNCEAAFRADVWGLDRSASIRRSDAVAADLGGGPYARAIALALVADVALVVLDSGAAFAERVRALAPAAAIVAAYPVPAPVLALHEIPA